MYELLVGGGIALVGGLLGAAIFAKGQKVGADIVWRVSGDKPPLFAKPTPGIEEASTEEMDANALMETEQNLEIEEGLHPGPASGDPFGFAHITDGTR